MSWSLNLIEITLSTYIKSIGKNISRISKIKTKCESQFTNKLERTFKDIIQSKDHHQKLFHIQHQEQQTKYQIWIVATEHIFNENDYFSHCVQRVFSTKSRCIFKNLEKILFKMGQYSKSSLSCYIGIRLGEFK